MLKKILLFPFRAIWSLLKVVLLLVWLIIRLVLNIILSIILPHKKDARFKSGYSKEYFRF